MKRFWFRLGNNKGSAMVILMVLISVLMIVTVIGVDVGVLIYHRAVLSNAIDAAVLAGAQELPASGAEARAVAEAFLVNNNVDMTRTSINIDTDLKGINIQSSKPVRTFFAPLIGRSEVVVNAGTKAKVGPASVQFTSVRPLVVEEQVLTYGQNVALKLNALTNYNGNFGAISLGGTGAQVYEDNLVYGFTGGLAIGDVVYTETGNMSSVINPVKNYLADDYSTFDNFDRDSKRLWVVPIVDSLEVSGSTSVTVMGFAQFFIEDIGRQSGQTEIYGRFVEYTGGGSMSETAPDYGLYGIKLVE